MHKGEEVTTHQLLSLPTMRIATPRDVAPQSIEGNVSGWHSGKKSKWCNVSDEPLPKKKTKKKK